MEITQEYIPVYNSRVTLPKELGVLLPGHRVKTSGGTKEWKPQAPSPSTTVSILQRDFM